MGSGRGNWRSLGGALLGPLLVTPGASGTLVTSVPEFIALWLCAGHAATGTVWLARLVLFVFLTPRFCGGQEGGGIPRRPGELASAAVQEENAGLDGHEE